MNDDRARTPTPAESPSGEALDPMYPEPEDCILLSFSPPIAHAPDFIHLTCAYPGSCSLPAPARRVFLARKVTRGASGTLWDAGALAVKVRSGTAREGGSLCAEAAAYATLEEHYVWGSLVAPLAPRFFGLYVGAGVEALVLEHFGRQLHMWSDLEPDEFNDVLDAVLLLHSVGIEHGDVHPRNVLRSLNGGFRLSNFAKSKSHECPAYTPAGVAVRRCPELNKLWKALSTAFDLKLAMYTQPGVG
ncbi:hypothetical protein FA95DRAFT_1603214 [Auriscalpium vulgare]|uniref:Uncharacterized protein n=1 Tax=Auriscalpium vulgare TaxID=40419 RepID=A0ACB8S4B6_9AGAM|nr:hypothetical protein FA95DRAFT_1603214 [Auriscalpium vulgare]